MTCRVDSVSLISGKCVVGNRGLGVTGAAIRATTATGAHGPGYLFNDWEPGDDEREFRGLIVTPPASGALVAYEDGSFDFTAPADGTYTFSYRLYVDGAELGLGLALFTVGAGSGIGVAVSAVGLVTYTGAAAVVASIVSASDVSGIVAAAGAITYAGDVSILATITDGSSSAGGVVVPVGSYNYRSLRLDIAGWLDRTDLTARIPSFVRLAEARIARDLRMPNQITTATVTVFAGDTSVALPTDFAEAVSVQNGTGFSHVSPSKLAELSAQGVAASVFTIRGNLLVIPSAAAADMSFTLTYYANFSALVGDSDTNALLTSSPGIYLYCALAEASVFLADDRTALWEAKYRKELEDTRTANWASGYSLSEQFSRLVA